MRNKHALSKASVMVHFEAELVRSVTSGKITVVLLLQECRAFRDCECRDILTHSVPRTSTTQRVLLTKFFFSSQLPSIVSD